MENEEINLDEYNDSPVEASHQPTRTKSINLDDLNDVPDSEKYFKIPLDAEIKPGTILTITDVKINQPQRLDKNGKDLAETNSKGVRYYKGRVEVRFAEEINGLKIRDFFSGLYWNVQDDGELKSLPTVSKAADLDDKFKSDLGKIRTMYCQYKRVDPKNVSDAQFLKGLKGLKVIVEKEKGTHPQTKQPYARLKIVRFTD